LGIPGIFSSPRRGCQLIPPIASRFLDRVDKIRTGAGGLEFRMHGGKEDQVDADFRAMRALVFDGAVGDQENQDVQGDEGKRNHGPSSTTHTLVTYRDQHRVLPETSLRSNRQESVVSG